MSECKHVDEILRVCGAGDVAVLPNHAQPAPGWLERLLVCLQSDAHIAAAIPWSNAGETAAWPRVGEVTQLTHPLSVMADACATLRPIYPALPTALSHAVLLRGGACSRVGGLDTASFGSWYAALLDVSLRMLGLGMRSVLCDTAFVCCQSEGIPHEGDMDVLAARWPACHADIAQWLMRDPLLPLREQLTQVVQGVRECQAQPDLFQDAP